jgi:hypothetical protein
MWGRKRAEVASHVRGYREGRRLMRVGDPADEWYGMALAKRHLLALIRLGRNEQGEKCSPAVLDEVLRVHGLKRDSV